MIHRVKCIKRAAVCLFALLSLWGCVSSPEFISEDSVESKVARLKLGQTDRAGVESIFGTDRSGDRNQWVYTFAERQFEISDRKQGLTPGALPVTMGVVPVNTRALVIVDFNQAGNVKQIEVARFFAEPFVNDYWYMVKETAKNPLEAVAAIAESLGFKATSLDKGAGAFTLEDPGSKARIAVKLDGQTLRLTSRNPHQRQSNEYRVYSKREGALINSIAESDLIQ